MTSSTALSLLIISPVITANFPFLCNYPTRSARVWWGSTRPEETSWVVEAICLLNHAEVPPHSSPDELHQLPIFSLQLPLFQSFLVFIAMMVQNLQVLSQNMFMISLNPLDLIPAAWFGLNMVFAHVSLMGQYSYSFGLCFTSLKHTILVLSQFVGQSLFIWCISTCTQTRLNSPFFLLNFVKFYLQRSNQGLADYF